MDLVCKKCGTINEYRTEKKSNNLVAYCTACGSYIKNIPYSKPQLHFGKYKGRLIEEMKHPEEVNYLHWVIKNAKINESLRIAISKHLML